MAESSNGSNSPAAALQKLSLNGNTDRCGQSNGCSKSAIHCSGILYRTPAEAIKGHKEKFLFVTAPNFADPPRPDAIVTIDVDPSSSTFSQVVSKLDFPYIGDEVHHFGWNACASCYGECGVQRKFLVLPCLNSSRIYVVNILNPRDLKLEKVIEPQELFALDLSFPHTSHCLADGNVMISTLGDKGGNHKGSFALVNGTTLTVERTWPLGDAHVPFNYDFWYQPRRNVMISTEWGTPNNIKKGFDPSEVLKGVYGNQVHVWEWKTHDLKQSITLEGATGYLPLEVRFKHEPEETNAFVGTALGSAIYHVYLNEKTEKYESRIAAAVHNKKVTNWVLPEMPGLITDILVSMDDKYLYASCWLHGEILQYDISDSFNVKLASKIHLGGLLHNESGVVVEGEESELPPPTIVKGTRVHGGPQMLQLSLDGKRLYVTTSLYSVWDKQFYPELRKNGSTLLLIDVGNDGAMSVNEDFLVDFGKLEGGPYAAHEMRYPGGDCTSDIWI